MGRIGGDAKNVNVNSAFKDCDTSSSGSVPITPVTNNYNGPDTETESHPVLVDSNEMLRLRKELDDARDQMSRMRNELQFNSIANSTVNHAIGQPSDMDGSNYWKGEVTEQTISRLQHAFNESTRPGKGNGLRDGWPTQDDTLSDTSEGAAMRPFGTNGQSAIWGNGMRPATGFNALPPTGQYGTATTNWNSEISRPPFYDANLTAGMGMSTQAFGSMQAQPRPTSGHSTYRGRNQFLNEPTHFPLDQGYRNGLSSNPPSRPGSAFEPPRYQYNGYQNALVPGVTGPGLSPTITPLPMAPVGTYGNNGIFPRPTSAGTRLSAEAAEFNVEMAPTPWNAQVKPRKFPLALNKAMANLKIKKPMVEANQYVSPGEPMNYRRLLDRNMNCNWKHIVDKIICNNDQQASIFLQQKLKVGTTEQKYEIVEAIIGQAYPLMVNRFGNFLVQRCFEHGTPEQVVAIATAIRGNTLTLSMDPFGCHVVQKAFDAVPEEYKATMVHELLRRIPETVIHRYACHVWQKLFELRWSDSPPQIMRYVNEALRGMWHEVALGETGSLVVQNIFENCLEEDKRPCINEVLASIDVISHGQFGNWCIQHICEHGCPADKQRAVDHILRFATEYSMDQYASKVIEKCLKIGGSEFLDRYLDRVCEGRADRPRMPLIDSKCLSSSSSLITLLKTAL